MIAGVIFLIVFRFQRYILALSSLDWPLKSSSITKGKLLSQSQIAKYF